MDKCKASQTPCQIYLTLDRASTAASVPSVSSDPSGEPAPERGGAHTYAGAISWEYSPELDRDADPGEIVWTWVAFEEDDRIGKDRPVAVVGRADDNRLVALMLSSKEHDGDRGWISIGTGPWDRQGRESWVRRDRILAVDADAVRREGAIIPRATYEAIVSGMGGSVRSSAGAKSAGGKRANGGLFGRLRSMFGGR